MSKLNKVYVQKNDRPKKQGTLNPLNIERTRNAQVAEKCQVEIQKNDGPKKNQGTPNPLIIEWTRSAQIPEIWKKGFLVHV